MAKKRTLKNKFLSVIINGEEKSILFAKISKRQEKTLENVKNLLLKTIIKSSNKGDEIKIEERGELDFKNHAYIIRGFLRNFVLYQNADKIEHQINSGGTSGMMFSL